MTALVHDPAVLQHRDLVKTVTAAVRLAVENERLRGQVEARTSEARTLPTGSVTFLFTDIEGSTRLLERLGDRYAALLADVRAIIRGAVHRGAGREVDSRADEFFAVFERAPAALDAALAIHKAMARRAWPEGLAVKVRAGIHRGRPTLTDTGYVGLAVHTVARICQAGHGAQILLSGPAPRATRWRGRGRPACAFRASGGTGSTGSASSSRCIRSRRRDSPRAFLRSDPPAPPTAADARGSARSRHPFRAQQPVHHDAAELARDAEPVAQRALFGEAELRRQSP